MRFLQEARDQIAHMLAAALLVGVLLWSPYTAPLVAFGIGYVRELTEEGTPVTLTKMVRAVITSKLDLFFWTLGGALALWIVGGF